MARPKGEGPSLSAEALRRTLGREEFDYVALLDALKGYAKPRSKVTALLRQQGIVRVKKGLYVFGPHVRRRSFSLEILANTIYGPSYLSFEFALAHYGLIPEAVAEVTSASLGRNKRFDTPVGRFTYRAVPERVFWTGVDRVDLDHGGACLMATREKALADLLYAARGQRWDSPREMMTHLVDSLRIDEDALLALDPKRLESIADRYGSRRVSLLPGAVALLRRELSHE